jgi:hypothetical protein
MQVAKSFRNPRLVGALVLTLVFLAVFVVLRRSAQARSDADESLYRCHLDEDSACMVVRQTARGLVVVSYRPPGRADAAKNWSVVVNDPGGGSHTVGAGTVYVVPAGPSSAKAVAETAPPPLPAPRLPASGAASPNGAPIVE